MADREVPPLVDIDVRLREQQVDALGSGRVSHRRTVPAEASVEPSRLEGRSSPVRGTGRDGRRRRRLLPVSSAGAIQMATTYETTTATITTGMRATASERKSRLGRSTAVMGIFKAPATIAPTPMAAPATIGSPPTWERAMPPAAPMNMLGKIGPPRNPLSEIA